MRHLSSDPQIDLRLNEINFLLFLGQSLYGVIVMNGVLLILKATKWFWTFSDEFLSQSPLFYIIGTVVIAVLTQNVIDVMTALAEVSREYLWERDH